MKTIFIKNNLLIIFIFSFFNCFSQDIKSDEEYYQEGIDYYKDALFDKAFIVFYNLSEKGDRDSQFNITNMFEQGVGTTQNFPEALKWCWLCALGGEKKCYEKIANILPKVDEKSLLKKKNEIEKFLEKKMNFNQDVKYALMLGFWYEKFSPEKDLELAYLWYSVAVTGGLYKAMKNRNSVGDSLEVETLVDLQNKASKIFSDIKYFNKKDKGK